MSTIIFYSLIFFLFNDTDTTDIYTLSLHDALPISFDADPKFFACLVRFESSSVPTTLPTAYDVYPLDGRNRRRLKRSEERFSRNAETDLVCRLLLEKKKRVESTWEVGAPVRYLGLDGKLS